MLTKLFISLLLVLAFAASQDFQAQRRTLSATEKSQAEKAWPAFFKSFQAAVSKRDKEALRNMMVKDFFFSGGGGDDNHDGDMRDEAFQFLDDPQIHAWQAFDKAIARGAVPAPPNPNANGKKYYSRVAPAAARRLTDLTNAPPWIAFFEFRDGRWYCTSFSECCD